MHRVVGGAFLPAPANQNPVSMATVWRQINSQEQDLVSLSECSIQSWLWSDWLLFLWGSYFILLSLFEIFAPISKSPPDLGLGYRLALIPPMMFVPLLKLLWDVVGNPVERYWVSSLWGLFIPNDQRFGWMRDFSILWHNAVNWIGVKTFIVHLTRGFTECIINL